MKIKIETEIDVNITSEQMAEMFLNMTDKEQANFFNSIYTIVNTNSINAKKEKDKEIKENIPWCDGIISFEKQISFIKEYLTEGGKTIIKSIK